MRPLVERQTYDRMCNFASRVERKRTGDNMVRVLLLVGVFLILLQIATVERNIKQERPAASVRKPFAETVEPL